MSEHYVEIAHRSRVSARSGMSMRTTGITDNGVGIPAKGDTLDFGSRDDLEQVRCQSVAQADSDISGITFVYGNWYGPNKRS